MANTVRRKIRLGTLFLFFMVLLSCGVGIYHLVRLRNDANLILKNNYESIDYGHRLLLALDSPTIKRSETFAMFDSILDLQEANLTEPGERNVTSAIRKAFELYRSGDNSPTTIHSIRSGIQRVLQLNMAAIEIKNAKAGNTANNALTYISLLAVIVFLVGLTFSYNFPFILTAPINALKEGIEEISRKNYKYRIHLDRKDEFGQMAEAFNDMAERLEHFENSNLNKIIFEKTRAEAVINSMKDASIGIDRNDIILFANNQALQFLGLQAKDMIGKPVDQVVKKNDLFRFLVQEKDSLPFKIVINNRENYFTKEILDIKQEETSSKVIVLKNITSFKELDVAKTNFIATISHELKTPLASSDLSLKLLEDERIGQLSTEQKELMSNLKQDNQRMLRILSELLNMAQVEAGKIQLDISEVDPELIMNNAINSVSNAAKEKKITIQKDYQDVHGRIKADAEKTGWVLNNFLTNAIKYAPENTVINVIIKSTGKQIQFAVTDQGQGIPSEYLSKVFERFFKVPGSKEAGTGLGLAISKEFIEAQGGQIWVRSEIGSGSNFGFNLPLAPLPPRGG